MELKFATGIEKISLLGKCDVYFNPTDPAFAERLLNTFNMLDSKQKEYEEKLHNTVNNRNIFELAREMDSEMRNAINNLFGTDVCTPVFDTLNVYAVADGLPVWVNFMLSLIDLTDSTYTKEQKLTNPRIKKYSTKYKGH